MSSTVPFPNSNVKDGAKVEKVKRVRKCTGPTTMDWKKERPNLSMDFLDGTQEPSNIVLPLESQESAILDDLITCYMGRNGDFIMANPLADPYGMRTFTISSSICSKLNFAAQRSLTLATHYSMVVRFVEDNRSLEVGRVNQALAAAIDKIVDCYFLQIGELEADVGKKIMNIQSLFHAIQPMLETMAFLSCISQKVFRKGARGGKTLSILHYFYTNTNSGSAVQEVALNLITHSSLPYLESVQKWISRGIIFDPYDEFMIVENPRIRLVHDDLSDEYWLKKYQVRNNLVPKFLEGVAEHILNSGKYLNAASHCVTGNLSLDLAPEVQLEYSPSDDYLELIENAYRFSSKYLLNILINDFNIIERMKSIKRYFLLQQGDFVTTVFDICNEELNKFICDIIPSRFAALVDIALRVPSTNDDSYRELINLSLKPLGLLVQVKKILNINTDQEFAPSNESHPPLTGIDAFALSVKSQWPVSLIFSKKVISCYQMLFRHLVYIKYIEMLLFKVWLHDMTYKKKIYAENYHAQRSFALRHKMISFVQNMSYYMMEEVLEPYWEDLVQEISSSESIDDLLKKHWTFLNNCVKDCLLTNLPLLKSFRDILTVCKHFTELVAAYESKPAEITAPHYTKNVETIERRFDDELDKFLKNVAEYATGNNNKMFCILYRFDVMTFSEDFTE